MGQCIHAGLRRYRRAQCYGQLRIQYRVARHQAQIAYGIFMMGFIRDYGGNGGFRACACRGGHGDKGRDPPPHFHQAAQLRRGAVRPHDQGGRRFGRIHGRAAANGNKAVTSVSAVAAGNGLRLSTARIGRHAAEQLIRGKLRRHGAKSVRLALPAAGHNQRLSCIAPGKQHRHLLQAACAADTLGLAPR